MPTDTISQLKQKYPQLQQIPDNVLTVELGNRYPEWLNASEDQQLKDNYNEYTSTTLSGVASQAYQGGAAVPSRTLKAVSGTVEALSENREGLGGNSIYDLIGAGIGSDLIGSAIRYFKGVDDISDGLNEAAREWTDYQDEQLRRRKQGGEVDSIFGGTYFTAGSESEMPTFFERGVGAAAESLGSLGLSIAAGGAGGITGAMSVAGAEVFGNTYADALRAYEANGDPDAKSKALGVALTDGAKTAVVTAAGGYLAKKYGGVDADNLLAELRTAGSPVRRGFAGYLKKIAPSVAAESIEEGIDEGLSATLAKQTYNPDLSWEEVLDNAAQGAFAGALVSKATSNIGYLADGIKARRLASELEAAGSPTAAKKVLENAQKKMQEQKAAQQEAAQSPAPVAEPDTEATPEQRETLELQSESIPTPLNATEVAASEEDVQTEMLPKPELSFDEIDGLAQQKAIYDLGLPNPEAESADFSPIDLLDRSQKDYFDEAYSFYRDSLKQYENDPEAFLRATNPEAAATAAPEAAPVVEPAAEPEQPATETQAQPDNIEADRAGFKKLQQLLAPLGGKYKSMKDAGEFRWFPAAGRKANAKNAAKRTAYPENLSSPLGKKSIEFKREVQKYAEKNNLSEADVLQRLKDLHYESEMIKRRRNVSDEQRAAVGKRNAEAADRVATLDNETEGDDIIGYINDNKGKIPVPVDAKGKIITNANRDIKDSGWDGSDDFLAMAAELYRKFPAAAERIFQKTPIDQISGADDVVEMMRRDGRVDDDYTTSDYYTDLASATGRRVSRVGGEEQTGQTEADYAKEQALAEQAERNALAQEIREQRRQLREARKREAEGVETVEADANAPFAAPVLIINGVRITKPDGEFEQEFFERVKTAAAWVQRVTGGAKIRRIVYFNNNDYVPAFSGARNGDFGTVYLNPTLITAIEEEGVGSLRNYISEEVIHNYGGLALYAEWRHSGQPGTFTEFYESYYRGVYDEMSQEDIDDTIYYYDNPEINAARAEAFSSDPVKIAEEYIRIALQRQMTGDVTERLYSHIQQDGMIRKLLRLLSRFWNGLTRGYVPGSPKITYLKRRINTLMGEQDVQFPAIDRGSTQLRTMASQMGLDFGPGPEPNIPVTSAEEQARKEAVAKPENGLNSNQGGWLDGLMAEAEVEHQAKKVEPEPLDDLESLMAARAGANEGDFVARYYYLSRLERLTETPLPGVEQTKIAGQKPEMVTSDTANWMQRPTNTDVILPDSILEMISTEIDQHFEKGLNRWGQVDDVTKENAKWYIYSRVANDARRYVKKYRHGNEDIARLLLTTGVSGRPNWRFTSTIYNQGKSFRERLRQRRLKAEGDVSGTNSMDEALQNAEGKFVTRYDVETSPNKLDMDPRAEVVHTAVDAAIQTAYRNLPRSQRDVLEFGVAMNFKRGWKAAYARKFEDVNGKPMSRANVTQVFEKARASVVSILAGSPVMDFDFDRLLRAAKTLPPNLRYEAVRIIENYEQQYIDNVRPSKAKEEFREIVTKQRLLGAADKLNITAASLPRRFVNRLIGDAKRSVYEQAVNYRAKKQSKAEAKRNDLRSPETKQRMKDAEGRKGSWWEDIVVTAKSSKEYLKSLTRTYKHIDPKKYPEVNNVLRRFDAISETSLANAAKIFQGITSGLSDSQVQFFRDILLYRDLLRSINEGLYDNKNLPFGIKSHDEVRQTAAQNEVDLQRPENKEVADAIARRSIILKEITDSMQERGLLPKKIAGGEEYFHRVVLKYLESGQNGVNARLTFRQDKDLNRDYSNRRADLRNRKAGFQRKRRGTDDDYSTNYFESELEVLTQSFAQIETHDILAELRHLTDVKAQMTRQANTRNQTELLNAGIDLNNFYQSQNKAMAIAMKRLQKMVASGTLQYASRFDAAAQSLGKSDQHPDFFAFLKHLADQNSDGAMEANMIFKAIREKEAKTKEALGDKYATWRTLANDSKDFTIWQPEQGNFLYTGTIASDQALIDWYEKATEGDQVVVSKAQLRNALVLGGRKPEWVVPKDIAAQFQSMVPEIPTFYGELTGRALAKWKQWKLFTPLGMGRYQINNAAGDADIVWAHNPRIFKFARQAAEDMWNYTFKNQPMTADMEEMMRQGVISSGATLQDLSEYNTEQVYRALFGGFPGVNTEGKNIPEKIRKILFDTSAVGMEKVLKLNQFRENILRIAAYRHFLAEIKAGKNPLGASSKTQIEALRETARDEEVAGKLARELLGDYGAISVAGQMVRRHLIPFWSWMEINAPRYVRMMRNLKYDDTVLGESSTGKVAGVAAKRAALGTAKKYAAFTVLSNTLPFFINAFNQFMVAIGAVDDEDEAVAEVRNQQHILLGTSSDGQVQSIRLQGALTDALDWFGLGNIHADVKNLMLGNTNLPEMADKWVTEDVWAAPQRLIGGANPLYKTPVEIIAGEKYYPDFKKPTPVRDRFLHFLESIDVNQLTTGATLAYEWAQDYPGRGISSRLFTDVLTYTTDMGEASYQYIKAKEYAFKSEMEGEKSGWSRNAKSDALYYYNKALQYGDKSSAEAWLEKYFEAGGKRSGIKNSIKGRAPLAAVGDQKRAFVATLSDREKDILKKAEKWYNGRR